jgi:hypothetical protein
LYKTFSALAALCLLAGCQEDNSGAARETRQTMMLSEEAAVSVGVPGIKNFTEKRQLKAIYELRDAANLVTYSYTIDINGKRHSVCPSTSVGFGIPYATQFTAPKAPRYAKPNYPDGTQGVWQNYNAEQPEPNGLYMPSSADGTWVICLDPNGKDLSPTYVEPRIVVYQFEMPHVD